MENAPLPIKREKPTILSKLCRKIPKCNIYIYIYIYKKKGDNYVTTNERVRPILSSISAIV